MGTIYYLPLLSQDNGLRENDFAETGFRLSSIFELLEIVLRYIYYMELLSFYFLLHCLYDVSLHVRWAPSPCSVDYDA